MACAACITLAWGDLPPLLFLLFSLLAFPLWILRNRVLFNGVDTAEDLSTDPLSAIGALVPQYSATLIVGVSICYYKDKLMRQNFVILQLVKHDRDRTLNQLTGEGTPCDG